MVRASILRARFSLSAVSSSTELLAVLTSIPSFFRRSMTSWLERFRSLASWKTLTFSIRLSPLAVGHDLSGGLRDLVPGRLRPLVRDGGLPLHLGRGLVGPRLLD